MRPAIYGYMRIPTDENDTEETAQIKRELAEYASREGFTSPGCRGSKKP